MKSYQNETNHKMALLETATAYILNIITENEEVKKFPTDFVSASMRWIRSWFLEDDPKMMAKLIDVTRRSEERRVGKEC